MGLYEEIEKSYPRIMKTLSEKDLFVFKNTDSSELNMFHFGLGLWIRNNLLYPEKSYLRQLFVENGIEHPDDMSSIIILMFHDYVSKLW